MNTASRADRALGERTERDPCDQPRTTPEGDSGSPVRRLLLRLPRARRGARRCGSAPHKSIRVTLARFVAGPAAGLVRRPCDIRGSLAWRTPGAHPTSDEHRVAEASQPRLGLRVSSSGGRCVLRAADWPIDLERHSAGGAPRFHQVERCIRTGVREEPRSLPDDHGIDEQGDLVDQLGVE
jgi:hypothetical protein